MKGQKADQIGEKKQICLIELVLMSFSPENTMKKKVGWFFFLVLIYLDQKYQTDFFLSVLSMTCVCK